jgi:hypothetical protein
VKIAADVKANKEGEDVFTEVSKREMYGDVGARSRIA